MTKLTDLQAAIQNENMARQVYENASLFREHLESLAVTPEPKPTEPITPQTSEWPAPPMPFASSSWRSVAQDDLIWYGDRKHERYRIKTDNGPRYLLHEIKKGAEVWPPNNFDSPFFPIELDDVECVMLTYLRLQHQYHSEPGKDFGFALGEGHYGKEQDDGEAYHTSSAPQSVTGTSGCTGNTMHPTIGQKSGIRLMGTWDSMSDKFGYNLGNGYPVAKLGQWERIQVCAWPRKGWQLWVDGEKAAEDFGRGPLCDTFRAHGVSVRIRNMYGGNPPSLPARWSVSERFANAWIHAV